MFGNVANPLLHGNGSGAGSYSAGDAEAEMAAASHDIVPTAAAGVIFIGVAILFLLDRASFKFVGTGSAGLGKG
jgi:hypothetical protein